MTDPQAVTEDHSPVLIAIEEGIATLTLNRPKQRNALSAGLMAAIGDALAELAEDDNVRVLILAGNGPVFCAGHDLKEIRANPQAGFYQSLFKQCSAMMLQILQLPSKVFKKATLKMRHLV